MLPLKNKITYLDFQSEAIFKKVSDATRTSVSTDGTSTDAVAPILIADTGWIDIGIDFTGLDGNGSGAYFSDETLSVSIAIGGGVGG